MPLRVRVRAYLRGFESLSFGASGAVSDLEAKQLEGGDGCSCAPTRTQRRRLDFAALHSGLLDALCGRCGLLLPRASHARMFAICLLGFGDAGARAARGVAAHLATKGKFRLGR